jgi:hypothetical protein
MWKSGVTKSAIAKRLHIYESDLNAVTFGLSSMPEKPPSTDEEAKGMRSGFSVV